MNITTSTRRPAIASSLAVAALMLSACGAGADDGADAADGTSADGADSADSGDGSAGPVARDGSGDGASKSNGIEGTTGAIDLTITPDGPITFDDAGTARYTVAWTAEAEDDEGCSMVLTVTDPDDQVINSVPVAGCDSSMEMTLVDGGGEAVPGDYVVELEGADDRAQATVTVEK